MPKKEKEKVGKIIEMEGLKELPITAISFGYMDWNETGNWRYLRPLYRTKTAPCIVECPAGEIISRYMLKSAQGEQEEAWKILIKDNPLPAACGRLCNHPCEAGCLRDDFDETVGVRDVERFLGDAAIGNWSLKPPTVVKDEEVAVVGAGPAGLTAAFHLARSGYRITLYDACESLGGSLRRSAPEFLLPSNILDGEIAHILSMGIKVQAGTRIADPALLTEMLNKYSAIYLSTGLPKNESGSVRTDLSFLEGFADLEDGHLLVNEDCQTSNDSVFAGGSVVTGSEMNIAEAIGWGRRGARAIDAYIKGRLGEKAGREKEVVTFENLNTGYFKKEKRNRQGVRDIKAGSFDEPVETLDETSAAAEAGRCFNCGICIFCDNCLIFCPDVAIDRAGKGYKIDYYHCKGCGICVNECPRDAMLMESELKWKK